MGQLRDIEAQIQTNGYQIIAASADRPGKLSGTVDENKLHYRLVSDADQSAAKAFGLAFRVDDHTNERYKGYGIDLEEASGKPHHILPVPAVYLIGKDGLITFSYVNPNYRVRLAPQILLAAVEVHGRTSKSE